jgi:hypothetical protein
MMQILFHFPLQLVFPGLTIKDSLHWRSLLSKLSATAARNSHTKVG